MSHYSPEAVARKWSVSVDTVYRLLNRNELHSFRVGRRRVVLEESVLAYERGETSKLAEVIPLHANH